MFVAKGMCTLTDPPKFHNNPQYTEVCNWSKLWTLYGGLNSTISSIRLISLLPKSGPVNGFGKMGHNGSEWGCSHHSLTHTKVNTCTTGLKHGLSHHITFNSYLPLPHFLLTKLIPHFSSYKWPRRCPATKWTDTQKVPLSWGDWQITGGQWVMPDNLMPLTPGP